VPPGGDPDVIIGGKEVELGSSVTESAKPGAERSQQTNATGRLRTFFMFEAPSLESEEAHLGRPA
jgi:hypothetical protein